MNWLARVLGALILGALVVGSAGCSSSDSRSSCSPDDQDGVVGGTATVMVSVSDTAFAVGGVNSGSMEPNITIQNSTRVTLTLTNAGTKPHDMVISCIPTNSSARCPMSMSCFPGDANIAALMPGESATVTFQAPAVEGGYQFISDIAGDTARDDQGNVSGLVGEFVLL